MKDKKISVEIPREEKVKLLIAEHTARLSRVIEKPTDSTLLSESGLTLEAIEQALDLTPVKEIQLPVIGDGFGGRLMGKVVQTDKPNVYLKSYVREKQPFIGNTEILYFGTESEGFKRFQANFEDSK